MPSTVPTTTPAAPIPSAVQATARWPDGRPSAGSLPLSFVARSQVEDRPQLRLDALAGCEFRARPRDLAGLQELARILKQGLRQGFVGGLRARCRADRQR